jgi:hypothetical protein
MLASVAASVSNGWGAGGGQGERGPELIDELLLGRTADFVGIAPAHGHLVGELARTGTQ